MIEDHWLEDDVLPPYQNDSPIYHEFLYQNYCLIELMLYLVTLQGTFWPVPSH